MNGVAKKLLILALVLMGIGLLLLTGIIDLGGAVAGYAVFPVGAVIFGLFLVVRMLAGESEAFENEERARMELANRADSGRGRR